MTSKSTMVMFGDRIALPVKCEPITLVNDPDFSLPELQCYPGDLNQVLTNIIDNTLRVAAPARSRGIQIYPMDGRFRRPRRPLI